MIAMDQENKPGKTLGVAVLTPSGTFPNDTDYRRAHEGEHIEVILKKAAEELKLTNTSDWVVLYENREIDGHKTFEQEGLSCVIELEWHKREGGGGS